MQTWESLIALPEKTHYLSQGECALHEEMSPQVVLDHVTKAQEQK